MTEHVAQRTSVSALVNLPVVDARGQICGRVREFAVHVRRDAAHVSGFLLKGAAGKESYVDVNALRLLPSGALAMKEGAETGTLEGAEDYLWLERDLLDQQIIDVHGRKVVRVNDVDLVWEPSEDGTEGGLSLRIAEVEVGLRGATRRLLKGLPASAVSGLAERFKARVIPWDFVDLIDRDPARRVRLKIEQDRLSKMHPSDIADILEDLAPAERDALFTSLDEEVAAEALEEVEPRLQKLLIEALDSERVAGIVEEMDPGAAADLLSTLPEERSDAILEEMDPEERQEVEELLEFEGDSAAGRMTTDYVSVPRTAVVRDAVAALRAFEGDAETITEIYLTDADEVLVGIVPLAPLLMADGDARLDGLGDGHVVHCLMDASGGHVAELFDKYNLRSLAVVDSQQRLQGVIHAEQVIAMLRKTD